MTLEIEINGRTRAVAIQPVPEMDGRFRVSIDGQERLVDAREIDASTLSLIMLDNAGACHEVEVLDGLAVGELLIRTRDGLLNATVNGRRLRRGGGEGAAGKAGEQRVTAPMPGKVVRVLVSPGDEVKAKQGVVVIEAMKMECELPSPKAGVVKQVAVEAGMSVEAGRLLVVVE